MSSTQNPSFNSIEIQASISFKSTNPQRMFGFQNGMNVVRTQVERGLRLDRTRWLRLDIDLNYPLPAQNDVVPPSDIPSLAPLRSPRLEVDLQAQNPPVRDVEVIDHEISIISPRIFAQVRKRPRREGGPVQEDAISVQANTTPAPPPTEAAPRAPVFRCPICMGSLEEATSTKCGHIFCKECIEEAITYRKKCPTCRKGIRGNKATFRVYLPTAI